MSRAVSGTPSCHFIPDLMVKVHTLPFADVFQLVARSGATSKPPLASGLYQVRKS